MLYQLYLPSDAYYVEHLIKKTDKLNIDWDNFKDQIELSGDLKSFLNNPNMVISLIVEGLKEMLIIKLKEELDISQELEDEIRDKLDENTDINSYVSCLNTAEAFEALKDKLYIQAEAEIEADEVVDLTKLKQLFEKYYIKQNLSAKDVE